MKNTSAELIDKPQEFAKLQAAQGELTSALSCLMAENEKEISHAPTVDFSVPKAAAPDTATPAK